MMEVDLQLLDIFSDDQGWSVTQLLLGEFIVNHQPDRSFCTPREWVTSDIGEKNIHTRKLSKV